MLSIYCLVFLFKECKRYVKFYISCISAAQAKQHNHYFILDYLLIIFPSFSVKRFCILPLAKVLVHKASQSVWWWFYHCLKYYFDLGPAFTSFDKFIFLILSLLHFDLFFYALLQYFHLCFFIVTSIRYCIWYS